VKDWKVTTLGFITWVWRIHLDSGGLFTKTSYDNLRIWLKTNLR